METVEVLRQNLAIGSSFKPMSAEEMQQVVALLKPWAADGRFELYKTSLHSNDIVTRQMHEMPLAGAQAQGDIVPVPHRQFKGNSISIIVIGGSSLGDIKYESEARRVVDEALGAGINFSDNAWEYHDGLSVERLGRFLRGKRDRAFVMTKVCSHGRKKDVAMAMFEDSLRRLQTDHLDLWQIHEVVYDNDPDLHFAPDGAIEALTQAKQQGKVRYVGFTGHKDPDSSQNASASLPVRHRVAAAQGPGAALLAQVVTVPPERAPLTQNRAPATVVPPPGAPSAPSPRVDRWFAAVASEGSDAELTMAKLALRRGRASEVKAFARKLIGEHLGLMQALAPHVRRVLPEKPAGTLSSADALTYYRLQHASDVECDQTYALAWVAGHLVTLGAFQTESTYGADGPLKTVAKQWAPTIEAHLQLAIDLTQHIGADGPLKTGAQ